MGVASQAARRRSPSEALLSNDVVVINGWLDQLVALAETDPMIGIAGPMTNSSSPDDLKSIHRFAAQSRSERLGR
jgi:GT2 family glycosyltransferase